MKFTDRQIIIFSALLVSLPLFFIGITGYDAVHHLIVSRLFAEQFFAGDLYPRWLFKAEAGYGSAVLCTYPAFYYYITLIFYPLKYLDALLNLPQGQLALYSSATLSMVLSALACHRLILLYIDDKKAVLGAAIFYLAFTYHLVDLYSRFALSELWAFVFIPLCIFYLKKDSFAKFTLSLAALALAHMLSVVMLLPVLIVLIMIEKQPKFFFAIILSLMLTAFYWAPGLEYAPLLSLPEGTGSYSIAANFLNPDKLVFFLSSFIPIIVVALTFFPVLKRRELEPGFWLLVGAACIFMSFSVSAFIWDILPPLMHKLSFPWRFLIISAIASTLLLTRIPGKLYPALIIISLTLALPGLMEKNSEDPNKYLESNLLNLDAYRGKWTPQSLVTKDGFKSAEKLQQLKFDGVTTIFRTREILVLSDKSGWVTIPQFYFPNWKSDYELRPEPKTGLIQANLPKPTSFTIKFEHSKTEKITLLISFITLLLLALKNRHAFVLRKRR